MSKKRKKLNNCCSHGILRTYCRDPDCVYIQNARLVDVCERRKRKGELRTNNISKITEYCLEIDCNEHLKIAVWHRYTAFKQLYDSLRESYGKDHIPRLHGRKYASFSPRLTTTMLHQRYTHLQQWISEIMESEVLRNTSEVKYFLTVGDNLSHEVLTVDAEELIIVEESGQGDHNNNNNNSNSNDSDFVHQDGGNYFNFYNT